MSLRRVAFGATYAIALPVLTALMLVAHIDTRVGHDAVRDTANRVLESLFMGRVHVGVVTAVHLDGSLEAHDITVDDAEHRRVLSGGTLTGGPLWMLWRGVRRRGDMPAAHIDVQRVWITGTPKDPGIPSFVDAFELRRHSAANGRITPPGLRFRFPSLGVTVHEVRSDIWSFPVRVTDANANGGIATDPVDLRVHRIAARADRTTRTPELSLLGSLDVRDEFVSSHAGAEAYYSHWIEAMAHVQGPGIDCRVHFHKRDDDAELDASDCRIVREIVDRASGRPIGSDVALTELSATRHGNESWHATARGSVAGEPFDIEVVSRGSDAVADLHVAGLDLSHVRADLPRTDLRGAVHVERHGNAIIVDTERLHAIVNSVVIPPAHARAHVDRSRLVIDEVRSESAGLTAHGEIDLAGSQHDGSLDVHVDTRDASALPFLTDRVHGHVRGDIHVDNINGEPHVRYAIHGDDIRTEGVRAASLDSRGTLHAHAGRILVDADVSANALVARGVGPLAVRAHVTGDPRGALEGRAHVEGNVLPGNRAAALGPTRADVAFSAHVGPRAVDVRIAHSPILLRGSPGTVAANIHIPLHGGAVSATAHLDTENAGSADIAVNGADVTGRFHGFSLSWIARALGTSTRIAGTIDGDLDLLTNRAGQSHGRIVWRDGHLPVLGDFNLEVNVDHRGPVSAIDALLAIGPTRNDPGAQDRPVVHGLLHVIPPARLGDLRGWLDGIRDGDVRAEHLAIASLLTGTHTGARIDGTADLHIVAHRTSAEAPLDVVTGIDVRNASIGADIVGALPVALRGLVPAAASHAQFVDPLRLRAAACGHVDRVDPLRSPLEWDLGLARESGDPIVAPPEQCDDAVIAGMHERFVLSTGRVHGPWAPGMASALAEWQRAHLSMAHIGDVTLTGATRHALEESEIDGTVNAGPLDTDHWPIRDAVGLFVPALARPRFNGRLETDIHVHGNLYGPSVDLTSRVRTSGLAQFAARDRVEGQVVAHVAPLVAGGSILGATEITARVNGSLVTDTPRGEQNAGTLTGDLDVTVALPALLDPADGLRVADFRHLFVQTSRLQLGRLRWAHSNNIDGLLELTVRATGIAPTLVDGTDVRTPIAVSATVADLRVRMQRTMAASADALVRNVGGQWQIQSCATMTGSAAPQARCDPTADMTAAPPNGLRGRVTLPLNGQLLAFSPDVAHMSAALATRDFPLETISPLLETPPIVRVGGLLTSNLDWSAAHARTITGSMHVHHGMIDLERVGVPAREIDLDITANGRNAAIDHLSMRLGTGRADGRGHFEFAQSGDTVGTLTLHATTDQLPATQEGNLYGFINSVFDYTGTFRTDGQSGSLEVRTASVAVPSQASRDVQDLDPRSDIFVIGQTRLNTSRPARPYPIDIQYTTDQPVWMRRDDLEVAVLSHGQIHWDPAGLALRGELTEGNPHSWVEVLGKRFTFDRIGLEFDGSIVYNPVLDVAAHFDSPTSGTVRLTITGRYLAPEVTMSADSYPGASQGEVLSLLVLGRRDSQGANDQATISDSAATLVTGVLAGFGTNLARRQLETMHLPFVPRLIVEPGINSDYRYGLGGTLTAVPRLYVEGTYGTITNYQGSNTSADPGNRPSDFHGLAEYTLSEHWSVSANFGTSGRLGADVFYNFAP